MKNLENLTIHRFRGIRNLTLEELGQVNLLVGVNNSGKTSVLEAISTYCRPLEAIEWLNTSWRREIKYSRKPRLDALKWLFPQTSESGNVEFYRGETYISANGDYPVKEARAIYHEFEALTLSKVPEIIPGEPIEVDFLDFENTLHGASLDLTAILNRADGTRAELTEHYSIWANNRLVNRRSNPEATLPVDTVTPFSHRIEQLQVGLLSEATFRGFKPEVIRLLQIMDLGIVDLEILSLQGSSSNLYIDSKQVGIAPLSAFGDGVRRLLFIALTLAKVRGGILLIDEIETAIHTEALRSSFAWIVQWCKEMNVQLFATTHSLEAVDALLAATASTTDLILYRIEQKEAQTKAVRIERDRLQRLRENLGQEVRY